MYIDALELKNLRNFASASMRFNHPDAAQASHLPNVSLIVGLNGAGKTTVLRAIALAVMGSTLASTGFVPRAFVRRGPDDLTNTATKPARLIADLVAHQIDNPSATYRTADNVFSEPSLLRSTVQIERHSDREVIAAGRSAKAGRTLAKQFRSHSSESDLSRADFTVADVMGLLYDDSSPAYFVVGYPASRRIENPDTERTTRLPRYERVAGLFEDHANLVHLGSWLPHLFSENPNRFEEIITIVNQLLPTGTEIQGVATGGRDLHFDHRGSSVPLHALSDGYRSYIGWIGDLLYHLNAVAAPDQKLLDVPGVVLLDEIDSHLHPEWQRKILPLISATFEHLQIIATTHSPMVVGTVRAANLIHLRPSNDGNATVAEPVVTELYGRNANQILVSELFGLESTRDHDFVKKMSQIAAEAAGGDNEAASHLVEMASFGAAGADIGSKLRERVETVIPSSHARQLLDDI